MSDRTSGRIHVEVQAELPSYVDRTLPAFRRKLVALHLRRCAECQAEFSLQREVAEGLAALAISDEPPPEGKIDALLSSPRAVVPRHGAARPTYSAALLLVGAAAGAGAGYASWLSAKNVRKLFRR